MEEWDDSYAYYHYQRPTRGGLGWITGGLIVDFILTTILVLLIAYFLFNYVAENYRQYQAFQENLRSKTLPPPVSQSVEKFRGSEDDAILRRAEEAEIVRLRRALEEKEALLSRQDKGRFYQGNSFYGFGNGSPPRSAAGRALVTQAFSSQEGFLPQPAPLFPQPAFGGAPVQHQLQAQQPLPFQQSPAQMPFVQAPRMSVFGGVDTTPAPAFQRTDPFVNANLCGNAPAPVVSNPFAGGVPAFGANTTPANTFAPQSNIFSTAPTTNPFQVNAHLNPPAAQFPTNDFNRQFMADAQSVSCGGNEQSRPTTMYCGEAQHNEPGPHFSPGGGFGVANGTSGRRSGAAGRMDSPKGTVGFERPAMNTVASDVRSARGGCSMTFETAPKTSRPPLSMVVKRGTVNSRVSEVERNTMLNRTPAGRVMNFDEMPVGRGF